MEQHDPAVAEAHSTCRQHEIRAAQDQRLAAHQSRIAHPIYQGQGDEIALQSGTQYGDDRDYQDEIGERDGHFQDAHEHRIEPATEVTGYKADQSAKNDRPDHAEKGHGKVTARAIDDPGDRKSTRLNSSHMTI